MLTESRIINVMGTDVRILFKREADDNKLSESSGYYDSSQNIIVVKIPDEERNCVGNLENWQKEVLRHEIIHAFLHESGLAWCTAETDCWAMNEEMVDWFALQSPKIFKIFKEQELV